MNSKELRQALKGMADDVVTPEDFVAAFDAVMTVFLDMKAGNEQERKDMQQTLQDAIRTLRSKVPKDGNDGHTPTKQELLALITPLIPQVENGVSPEIQDIVDEVMAQIQLPEQKETILDDGRGIVEKINALPVDPHNQIDAKHIKNLPKPDGNGGGAHIVGRGALYSLADVNLTNLSVNQSIKWDGVQWIPFTPSGAGGGYQVPLSGVVDGVNKTFVWSTAPSAICVDQGRVMQKTNSSPDLTANWSGTTTTILAIAPTFDIYSIA